MHDLTEETGLSVLIIATHAIKICEIRFSAVVFDSREDWGLDAATAFPLPMPPATHPNHAFEEKLTSRGDVQGL